MRKIILSIVLLAISPFYIMCEDDFEDFKVDYNKSEQKITNNITENKNNKKIQGKINSYILLLPDNKNFLEYTKLSIEFTDNYDNLFFYAKGNIKHSSIDEKDNRKGENIRLDIQEAYIDYTNMLSFIETNIRIGQQIINWGKADEIRPTDILNPQDLRLLILEERNERKMGRITFRGSLSYKSFKVEGFLFPFHNSTILPIEDEDIFIPESIKNIKKTFPTISLVEKKVKNNLSNADFAGRLYINVLDTDISFLYYRGYDPTPFTLLDLSYNKLILYQNKIEFYGFDFERVIGSFGIRGECAYFTKGMLFKKSISNIEKDYLDFTFGIDKTDFLFQNMYINLQYNLNWIKDYEDNIISRYGTKIKEYNHSGIYTIYYEFGNLKYRIEFKGNYNFTNKDGVFSPTFHIKIGPQTKFIIGGYIFFGEKDTYLGQYNNRDFGYLKLEHLF